MANPKTQSTQPKLKVKWWQHQWIPLTILLAVMATIGLDMAGFITLPHFGNSDSNVFEFSDDAIIGEPWSYDFANQLIPLLPQDSLGGPYSFYLGSGVGFPPMGLILGIDGVLRGTPTGKGGKFQVCVKDVSGKAVCRTYLLNTKSASDDSDDNPPGYTCPTTSCDTGSCCGSAGSTSNGITPTTAGVLVRDFCDCPSDTYYSGVTDTTAAGGPWKICNCKGAG